MEAYAFYSPTQNILRRPNDKLDLCQEPYSSIALYALLYKKNQGSNPPSPNVSSIVSG